jgi:hypothetical protein
MFTDSQKKIVLEYLRVMPETLGFQYDPEIGIKSSECIIRFLFERFEDTYNILISSPNAPTEELSYPILRQLRSVSSIGEDSYEMKGRVLATRFADLLSGDFSIRSEYELMEKRIALGALRVLSLPHDHPIRALYEGCDLQWLDQIEKGSKNRPQF